MWTKIFAAHTLVSLKSDCSFIPHEFACLNHSVLSAAHKYTPPTGHTHFTLRQQPQASVQLRNEILQKGWWTFYHVLHTWELLDVAKCKSIILAL